MSDFSDAVWKVIRADGSEEEIPAPRFEYDSEKTSVVFDDHVVLRNGDSIQVTNTVEGGY